MYLTLDSRFRAQAFFCSVAGTHSIPQNPSEVLLKFMIFFTEMKNSTPDRSYDLLSAIVRRILLISLIFLHIPFIIIIIL